MPGKGCRAAPGACRDLKDEGQPQETRARKRFTALVQVLSQQAAAVVQGTGSPALTERRWHQGGDRLAEGFWDRSLPTSKEDGSQDELPGHECVVMDVQGRENPQQQTPNQLLCCHEGHLVSPRRITCCCYRPTSLISRRVWP